MKKIFSFFAFLAILFASCEYNNRPVAETNNEDSYTKVIRQVRKLENPYSVSSMRKAYAALQSEGKMSAPMNIEATHLYVRFLPKDTVELEKLYNDTTLRLFPFPLDCELTEGTVYKDPTLKGSQFTWLYTRVPVGYSPYISGYEVLDELYLPTPEYNDGEIMHKIQGSQSQFMADWEQLENMSLKLTGNEEQIVTDSASDNGDGAVMQKAPWYPKAVIRVYDDYTGSYLPVPDALVVARYWFSWQYAVTNEEGVATISKKRKKVDWFLEWQSDCWAIRDGLFWLAVYNGGMGWTSDWHLDINDHLSKAYAHINRACYTMFWGNNLGSTNRDNNWRFKGTRKIKISVHDLKNKTPGHNNPFTFESTIFSQIAMYLKDETNNYRLSQDIFATAIHELAHSFHTVDMDLDVISDIFVSPMITESWARAVECLVTNRTYQKLGYPMKYRYNSQGWAINKSTQNVIDGHSKNYSPIFIDLVDNENQFTSSYSYEYPNDNVEGFALSELRSKLRITFNLKDLKRNAKALRNSTTIHSNIDKLFETYEKAK